jgi:hypothetical protein
MDLSNKENTTSSTNQEKKCVALFPEPVTADLQTVYNGEIDTRLAIKALRNDKTLLITGFYSNGLTLLKALKLDLKKKYAKDDFKAQRDYRAAYSKMSNLVLIEIVNHKVAVKKAPSIGWLEKLYPDLVDFVLPFPKVQGLNSAWQWYSRGITIPVLRNKIHPYYGVYFPTRFEHLILFDNWLNRYEGNKKSAIDVGIGSGVLSLQMIKHGFQKVFGTDTNPNAIVGLKESLGETKLSRKIDLEFGSLFGSYKKQVNLIVFNPPWLPKTQNLDIIDEAIYYTDNLFANFFEGAQKHLLPDGKLVLVFSNLAQITNATKKHPIEQELANGNRFVLEKCFTRKVKLASDKTKRTQNWRAEEEVELWVLNHK